MKIKLREEDKHKDIGDLSIGSNGSASAWTGNEWVKILDQEITKYEMAFNEFDSQLKEKKYPDLKEIMDYYMKDHPEYLL